MPYKLSPDGTQLVGKQKLALGRIAFKRIDDGSEVMGVDGRPSGASLLIWDGDTTAWTASGDGSATTASAHSGTYGWDSGSVGANSNTDFDNGSEIDVVGTYDVLSFWLQPKAFPGNGVLQVQWRNGSGAVIGSTLNIENYVSNMDLDVWQHVSIPVADFNLTANVQVLRITYKVGTQQHWLDDFHLEASGGGGPYTFRVSSPTGFVYHVERLVLVINAPSAGWNGDGFASLTSALENGLLLKYHLLGAEPETFWSFNVKNNQELFGMYGVWNEVAFDSGELMLAFEVNPDLSAVLLVDDDEVLDFIVRDDLSSLNIRAFLHYGTEVIES
jgi:hypothetical protein